MINSYCGLRGKPPVSSTAELASTDDDIHCCSGAVILGPATRDGKAIHVSSEDQHFFPQEYLVTFIANPTDPRANRYAVIDSAGEIGSEHAQNDRGVTVSSYAGGSLTMTPNAVIRAREGFSGDAVLIKGGGSKSKFSETSGWIRGGLIDGGLQPLTGIKVENVMRIEIADLVVLNATQKGIHLLQGGYEKNITRVRCEVDLNARYAPGSIGIHYENGDSKVILAHVIGYETGVRSDDDSNWFTMIHVWNYDPVQGPMRYCFYCNGGNNTFNQCYADSPTIAGFYVNRPYQSFLQCRVYYSRWAKDASGAGFLITPEGKFGNYFGNALFADDAHRLAKAFDGEMEGACILGTTTPGGVLGGFENRIPSGDPNTPPLNVGNGFCLAQQTKLPSPQEGQQGEIRWVDDGTSSALWLRTGAGWKKSQLV